MLFSLQAFDTRVGLIGCRRLLWKYHVWIIIPAQPWNTSVFH